MDQLERWSNFKGRTIQYKPRNNLDKSRFIIYYVCGGLSPEVLGRDREYKLVNDGITKSGPMERGKSDGDGTESDGAKERT